MASKPSKHPHGTIEIDMREIEIKVRVDAMDATLAKLEAAGVTMSKPTWSM